VGNLNQPLALEVIETLQRAGARTVCLCPGGRNAPLVEALEPARHTAFEVLDFFDERGAAFFALGRARRDGQPVAVVTTSGTAAAELLPAMVEAYYQGAPLVAVTADRPWSFRGTGAPQTIEQPNLFGVYARQAIDLDRAGTRWRIDPCCWPVHVNVSFEEPLLDGWDAEASAARESSPPPAAAGATSDAGAAVAAAASIRRPLVILGGLWSDGDREAAQSFCVRMRAPIIAEPSSHLRSRLGGLLLRGRERSAALGLERGWFDGVVRIGDVPSFRLWRDLERRKDLPVVSISRQPWRGLTHGVHVQVARGAPLPLEALAEGAAAGVSEHPELGSADGRIALAIEKLLKRFPQSEPAIVRRLSETIPAGSFVYLGNSLPIREWNQFASDQEFRYGENRGANGIDGQLSTFLGWAGPGHENWAVVGDLTTLYDLGAPWALRHVEAPLRIVVVNNGGGRIFRRLFRNPRFQHEHTLAFDQWARMWDAAYASDAGLVPERDPVIVELRPDPAETDRFWEGYKEAGQATM